MFIPLNKLSFELAIDLINASNNTAFTPDDLNLEDPVPIDDPAKPDANTSIVATGTGTTSYEGPDTLYYRRLSLARLLAARNVEFDMPANYVLRDVLMAINDRFDLALGEDEFEPVKNLPSGDSTVLTLTPVSWNFVYESGADVTVYADDGGGEEEGWRSVDVNGDSASMYNQYVVSTGWGRTYNVYDSRDMAHPEESIYSLPVESDMWSLKFAGGRHGMVAAGLDMGTLKLIIATYPLATMLGQQDASEFHRFEAVEGDELFTTGFFIAAHPLLDKVFFATSPQTNTPTKIYSRSFTDPTAPWELYADMGDSYFYGPGKDQDWLTAECDLRAFYADPVTGALRLNIAFAGEANGSCIVGIETIDPLRTQDLEFTLKPAEVIRFYTDDTANTLYSTLVTDPFNGGHFIMEIRGDDSTLLRLTAVDTVLDTGQPNSSGGSGARSHSAIVNPAGYQTYLESTTTVVAPAPNCEGGVGGGILEQPIMLYSRDGVIESGSYVRGGFYADPYVFPDMMVTYGRYNEVCNPN